MSASFASSGVLATALAGMLVAAEPVDDAQELWVVVHETNPVDVLDATALYEIFTSARRFWPDRRPVVPINAPPRSETRERFDRVVLHMSPTAAGRFWIDQRVRGQAAPPRKLRPEIAVKIFGRLKTAIAYVPSGRCHPDIKVVAIVRRDGVHPPRGDGGEPPCAHP